MVKHLSDDQLKRLRLGGHDPVKVFNAYKAATEHKGQPTVVLARTIKGYGLGEAGEGKNITHQQKKLNESDLRIFRTRFGIPVSDDEIADAPFYRPPDDSIELQYLQERRKALGGFVPVAQGESSKPIEPPSRRAVRRVLQGHRRPQGLDDDGVRAAAVEAAARQGDRRAGRADRAGRGAHVRHGVAVPRGRHLLARRPEVRAGRHGHPPLLQGGAGRPDPRGRDHRGGLALVVHRRRHGLRQPRRQHDPVLHLLLDVRVPARRRPDLGRRRLADARLPARRHRRPDDARRRGPAAPGRQQPRVLAVLSRTASPTTRPSPTSWR